MKKSSATNVTIVVLATTIVFYVVDFDEGEKRFRFITSMLILALAAGLAVNYREQLKAGYRDFLSRFQGLEFNDCSLPGKICRVFLGILRRWLSQAYRSSLFIIVPAGIVVALVTWFPHVLIIYGEAEPAVDWVDSISGFGVFLGLTLAVTYLAYKAFSTFNEVRQSESPRVIVQDQLMYMVARRGDDYQDSSEPRIEIAVNDPGPITLISTTGADLLQDYAKHESAFHAAWAIDPQKQFRLLLADPASFNLRARVRRLNARYLESYVLPYLQMLLIRMSELESGVDRFKVYCLSKDVDYRTIQSHNRILLQRYSRFEYGRLSDFFILNRVNVAVDVEEQFRRVGPCTEIARDETSPLSEYKCVLRDPKFCDIESQGFPASADTLYGRLSERLLLQIENMEEEKFTTEWDSDRLQRLAKYCRINKKERKAAKGDSIRLSRAIFERVGLANDFDNATKSTVRIQAD